MAIESRAWVRVSIDATVMVEVDMGMKEKVRILHEPQKAVVVDISVGGMGLVAPIFFPKNALLDIRFDASIFDFDRPAKIIGEVRYCRPTNDGKYRVGVKYVEIEKTLLARIKNYVEQNKDKSV